MQASFVKGKPYFPKSFISFASSPAFHLTSCNDLLKLPALIYIIYIWIDKKEQNAAGKKPLMGLGFIRKSMSNDFIERTKMDTIEHF